MKMTRKLLSLPIVATFAFAGGVFLAPDGGSQFGPAAAYAGGKGGGPGGGGGHGGGHGGGRGHDGAAGNSDGYDGHDHGNGHGRGHAKGHGGSQGAISSELGGYNAANASARARERAAPHSQVGKTAQYEGVMQDKLDEGLSLAEAHDEAVAELGEAFSDLSDLSEDAIGALADMLGLEESSEASSE